MSYLPVNGVQSARRSLPQVHGTPDRAIHNPRSLVRNLSRVLGSRYWPAVLTLAAVVVSLPAVRTGPLTDDFVHRAILIGPSPCVDRLSEAGLAQEKSGHLLYVLQHMYITVHPQENFDSLKAYGVLPWWTYEGFRVAFWRPVAAFTCWLDYQLFPESFELMHLHSILWFAAAVFAVAALYRRVAGVGWIAGLAALMYLLDDSSYFPTMWIANRNLLVSLFFAILTLIVHDRWRKGEWRPGAVVAPMCLFVSVLSAEAGIATFAYLFAYEVALERGRLIRRGMALAPSVTVVLLWRLLYNLQGYGANGGGFYFDPAREPFGYMLAVLHRLPFLLGGQWTTVPPDLYGFAPPTTKALLWLFLTLAAVVIPLALLPVLRANRRAVFWLVGMYGSALPFCATIPMSRTLPFVAIGAFGLLAEFITGWLTRESWVPATPWRRRMGGLLFTVLFLAHVPLAAATRIGAPRMTMRLQEKVAETMNVDFVGVSEQQDLIIVNSPNPAGLLYDPFIRAHEGRPLPRGIHMLTPGFGPVHVVRTGARRLVVRSVSQSLFDCEPGNRVDFVFFYHYLSDVRSRQHPLRVGQRISLPRMEVEVLTVDERGFPVEAAFEFDVPLEDSSLKWLQWDWDDDVYRPFDLPAVGGAADLVGPF